MDWTKKWGTKEKNKQKQRIHKPTQSGGHTKKNR